MNKNDLKNLTTEQKLDYLIAKVEAIDYTVNPPWWKGLIQWFIRNFWTLLMLTLILWGLWELWQIVQAVQAQVEAVGDRVNSVKTSVRESLAPVTESVNSMKESIQSINLDRVKFWE